MQNNLDSAIDITNGFIKEFNKENDVSTPLLHTVLIRRRGRKGRYYTINQWAALRDGIHGTYKTRDLWSKSLQAAMDLNSKADEQALDASPKRSWKFEKRQRTQ